MTAATTRPWATTDPELARQLDAAHGTGRPVEAVLMLRDADRATYRSDSGRREADAVVARVEREVGVAPSAVNVLANLGMVVVAAQESFLRKLLDQPEFASAAANGHDTSHDNGPSDGPDGAGSPGGNGASATDGSGGAAVAGGNGER